MTAAERGTLLLCCDLGGQGARPLSEAQFRLLSRRARGMGPGNTGLDRELEAGDLTRLGYSAEEASHIVALLDGGARLDRYLEAGRLDGIFPLTCQSGDYPARLLHTPGGSAPPVFFCAGNRALLRGPFVGLAGSRQLSARGAAFARRAGELAAREGLVLVTGGARGADWTAVTACLRNGGRTVVFVPDALHRRVREAGPNCLLLSAGGYGVPFSTARALSRNVWVHKMGESTLIAQTGFGRGGTWRGGVDNLRMGWSDLYVNDDGSPGASALADMGAVPLRRLDSISGLVPLQRTFF